MQNKLIRYWFKFEIETGIGYPGIGYGCGITAYSLEDSINIMDQKIFTSIKRPPFRTVKENVDVSTLDQGHVIPNMKHPLARGVWFPLGYD